MKVLHLIDSGGLYGAEQMLLALTEEQIKQGVEPIILSCGLPNEADKALEIEAGKRNIPVIKWRMKAGLNFKGSWQILKYAKKEQVDILHSHGYKFNILFATFPKFIRKIPFITTVHGYVKATVFTKMWLYEILDRVALKNIEHTVAVSLAMTDMNVFNQLGENKYSIIQNGIAIKNSEFKTVKVAKSIPLKIMAVGRLSPEKGFDYLIKAIHELKRDNIDVKLTIYGDGGLKTQLLKVIESLQLSKDVTLAGFSENIPDEMRKYDMLIMPSLTEGIPITLLEAIREKIVVCASNVGGIPEVLGRDYALLTEAAKPSSISEKIKLYLNFDSKEINQILQQNFLKFKNDFSSTQMQNQYQNIYSEIVEVNH